MLFALNLRVMTEVLLVDFVSITRPRITRYDDDVHLDMASSIKLLVLFFTYLIVVLE